MQGERERTLVRRFFFNKEKPSIQYNTENYKQMQCVIILRMMKGGKG